MLKKNFDLKTTLIALNKPKGVICSHNDDKNRKVIYELIPKKSLRVIEGKLHSVGRLDYNSQGLILLTNNTEIKKHLESPSNKFLRVYKVKVQGEIKKELLTKIRAGVIINKITYKVKSIKIIKVNKSYAWLLIKLTEGKNQHIRKVFSKFGLSVNKLIRIQYGPFKLSSLKSGSIRFLKPFIIKNRK